MSEITINNIDQHIDRLERAKGVLLFQTKKVLALNEVDDNIWESVVESPNPLVVSINLQGDTVKWFECECKEYGAQTVCSHIYATLLAINKKRSQILTRSEAMQKARDARRVRNAADDDWANAVNEPSAIVTPINSPKTMKKIKNFDDFLSVFQDSTIEEQRIITILALGWDYKTNSKVLNLYLKSNFDYPYSLKKGESESIVEGLVHNKMLLKKGSTYGCDQTYAQALCMYFYKTDKTYKSIIQAISSDYLADYWGHYSNPDTHFNKMRLAFFIQNAREFIGHYSQNIKLNQKWPTKYLVDFWLSDKDFSSDWMDTVEPEIGRFLLAEKLNIIGLTLGDHTPYLKYVSALLEGNSSEDYEEIRKFMARIQLFRGDWAALNKTIATFTDPIHTLVFNGILSLLKGDGAHADLLFTEAEKRHRKFVKSNKVNLGGLAAIFWVLSLLKEQKPGDVERASTIIAKNTKTPDVFHRSFLALEAIIKLLQNNRKEAKEDLEYLHSELASNQMFCYIATFLVDPALLPTKKLAAFRAANKLNGYQWVADEMEYLQATDSDGAVPKNNATIPLCNLFPRVEEWEMALTALLNLSQKTVAETAKEADTRLIWLVNFEKEQLEAKEQTFGKKGWTPGRVVPEYRLVRKEVNNLTPQDERIMAAMASKERYNYYYEPNWPEIWKALVGHPRLYLLKSPEVSVQLERKDPVLVAKTNANGGYELRFVPPIEMAGVQIIKESPTRYHLIEATEAHFKIAKTFNGKSLTIPESGFERFSQAVSGLSEIVTVQADMALANENIPEIAAEQRTCVHLLPVGEGFHVELYAKPFGATPPYFKPGDGEPIVVALVEGQRTQTTRDLKIEVKNAKAVKEQISAFGGKKGITATLELESTDECLEFLTEINPMVQNESIILEWPKGEKFKVTQVMGIDKFKVSIQSGSQWFEVDGSLRVDENRVLNMQELLALSEQQKSPFIELSPGRFLALTKEFREKLRAISGLMSKGKNGKMTLHTLAASAMSVLTDVLQNAELDEKYKANNEKIHQAFSQKFKIPEQFNAELRPYQQEGFEWLHRLAAWGVGACLADDMGLGKTVQALAFLTDRAQMGPALVVAPVSVCRNWVMEIAKFAPALRSILFSEGDRSSHLKVAGKSDIVIVTYDLLTREGEQFIDKKWATIVLDEAQAIKNRSTKRSEVAMQLQTDFRLIMSGTPVENHLGELWNLFQFANPGLLGSLDQFHERFTLPIEKFKDDARRDTLRRLVQPFILRRRKDEVLKELPAKTEITLSVELSQDERAFYEALRRKALEALENGDDDAGGGEKHLRILAEIMKLRRAACHPQLADANASIIESAKERLFGEIVSELIENGHKALVFSQFVTHLAILEKVLKKQNVKYQYLDGQTPSAKRQKNIDAFQNGEGDIFLISLKAGGTGLNLTNADYVIHMDPWWNPAVEDQATDRAHRIGQLKPVTVYRFVAENTIEEKIIQLHERKRDLADSLLSGTGASAKLTADDLMALLKG
jgi:superfamily II DNA or RNA helicase